MTSRFFFTKKRCSSKSKKKNSFQAFFFVYLWIISLFQWAVMWLCQRSQDLSLRRMWPQTAPAACRSSLSSGWSPTPWWQSAPWSSSSCCSCCCCPAGGEGASGRSQTSLRWSDTGSNDSEEPDEWARRTGRRRDAERPTPLAHHDEQLNARLTSRRPHGFGFSGHLCPLKGISPPEVLLKPQMDTHIQTSDQSTEEQWTLKRHSQTMTTFLFELFFWKMSSFSVYSDSMRAEGLFKALKTFSALKTNKPPKPGNLRKDSENVERKRSKWSGPS